MYNDKLCGWILSSSQVSLKLGVSVDTVKNVIIWGNHSSTQYPDVNHGVVVRSDGMSVPIRAAINDDEYLRVGDSPRNQILP